MHPAVKLVWTLGKVAIASVAWLAAITIDETTLIPLGSALFVLSGVWYLSARLQRADDDLKELRRRVKDLEDK